MKPTPKPEFSAPPSATDGEIGILARRRIEAAVIAPLYRAMCEEIGEAKARAILEKTIHDAAHAAGQDFASKEPQGADLRSFQALQSLWLQDDALSIEILNASETRFDYNVHRCRYAETYREMGIGDIGHILSCGRDGAFCQGYDPSINFTRTQTLMQGAAYCDFRYARDADVPEPASAKNPE